MNTDDRSSLLPEDLLSDAEAEALQSLPLEAFETASANPDVVDDEAAIPNDPDITNLFAEISGATAPRPKRPARRRSPKQLEKARHRQEVYLQKRRRQKRRRIFYQRLRSFLKVILALVLAASLYLLAQAPFWRFSDQSFALHGATLINRGQIQKFLIPYRDKPLYQLNPSQVATAIRQELPLVGSIAIRRRLMPLGLDISIVEKPAWGVVYPAPPQAGQPAEHILPPMMGLTLKHADTESADTVQPAIQPTYLLHPDNSVTNLAPYQPVQGDLSRLSEESVVLVSPSPQRLKPHQVARLREVTELLASRPDQARLLYLDVSDPADLRAQFEGFQVRFGHADRSVITRLSRLFSILPVIRERQKELAYVDLRWNQQVLLKKKDPAQQSEADAAVADVSRSDEDTAVTHHALPPSAH